MLWLRRGSWCFLFLLFSRKPAAVAAARRGPQVMTLGGINGENRGMRPPEDWLPSRPRLGLIYKSAPYMKWGLQGGFAGLRQFRGSRLRAVGDHTP